MNDDIRYGWGEIVSEGGTACTWDGGGAGKILQIRGLMLGQGRPKICVPVVETTSEAILQSARRVRASEAELLEWRADYWEEDEQTKRVGQMLREIRREIGEMPLLFTCRTRDEGGRFPGGPEYLRLNQAAIESRQADLVDVELRVGETAFRELCRQAHAAGRYILASSHDFAGTPPKEEMAARFARMEEWGADVLKMAVMPKDREDLLRLLSTSLLVSRRALRPVTAISMGEAGLESRVCGEAFGSALTFGCLDKPSAPGQMEVGELAHILRALHAAHRG